MQKIALTSLTKETLKINISKYYPTALLICFILQQIGLNYHFSFATLGLALSLYLVRHRIDKNSLQKSLWLCIAVSLSYFLVLARYGYQDQLLRSLPTIVSLAALVLLLNKELYIPAPSEKIISTIALFICSIAWYQLFIDKSLQLPEYLFAKGSNLSYTDDISIYAYHQNTLRANSIYTEPSYLGMILCCLYALISKNTIRRKNLIILIIIITQLLCGSALGIFGTALITAILIAKSSSKKVLLPILLIAPPLIHLLFSQLLHKYEFTLLTRMLNEGGDASFLVRIVNPFFLIAENIANFDYLGIPSNFYDHFLYTGLYNSMGDFPGHNGILGLVLHYGIAGMLIIALILTKLKNPLEWCLFLIIFSQNGSFLSYDKVLTFTFTLMTTRYLSVQNSKTDRQSIKYAST